MDQFLQQLVNGLALGSTYAVVALGFGLVFSVMGVINLAHPEFFMLGAFITVAVVRVMPELSPLLPGPVLLLLVVGVAIVATGGLGLVLERLVIRPLRGRYVLMPFIATAGVAIILQNSVQWIVGPDPVAVPELIPDTVFSLSGLLVSIRQLVVIATGVAMMVGFGYYVRRTKYGHATRAISEKWETAAACGVNVNLVSQLTVGLSTAAAGVAGVAVGILIGSATPAMGLIFGIKSFIAMLVAGNKRLEGIMAVGISLGVIEALVAGYISSSYRDAVSFALLLGILVFRPHGLFGSYEHETAGA